MTSFLNRHRFWSLLLVFSSVAFVSNAFKPRDFHPQNLQCTSCHLPTDVTEKNAHQLVDSQERLCGNCHASALQVSHPTGFVPTRNLPASYPVDWKGDVTCSTCHQVHGSEHGLLRGNKAGRDFCLGCHNEGFFADMADQGTSIHLTGHLAASPLPNNLELDPYSLKCLSCHGENGGGPLLKVDSRGIVRHGGGSGNHPIGMDYGRTRGIGLYKRVGDLPSGVLLPGGKVGCVSCHVGYSKQHGALVMSNRRSALCMVCHEI